MMHDEIEIEDMDWSEELQAFTYQCPCGDLFQITLEELTAGGHAAAALALPPPTAATGALPPAPSRLAPLPSCRRRGDCQVPLLLAVRASHLRP